MAVPTTIKAEYLRATAAEKALADRIYALEHPAAPPPPPVIPSGQSLQQIVDGTFAGGSVDLTGWSGIGGATITKPLTIKGGSLSFSFGDAVAVNAKGVTIEGLTIRGDGRGRSGIWATHSDGLVVVNCTIFDLSYAGIMVLESVGGEVSRNTVCRIGAGQPNGTNAYGIAFSDMGGPPTSDFLADANLIEDVPTWEGMDTHNGLRLTWTNNITRRVRRPYWLNASDGKRPTSCVIKSNRAEEVPQPVYDPTAFLAQNTDGCSFLDNSMSLDYPVGTAGEWHNFIRDYLNGSTGLICSGNVRA